MKDRDSSKSMTLDKFKTMVVVKLELLRGCCNTSSIKKSQISKSIEEFINKVTTVEITSNEKLARMEAVMKTVEDYIGAKSGIDSFDYYNVMSECVRAFKKDFPQ